MSQQRPGKIAANDDLIIPVLLPEDLGMSVEVGQYLTVGRLGNHLGRGEVA